MQTHPSPHPLHARVAEVHAKLLKADECRTALSVALHIRGTDPLLDFSEAPLSEPLKVRFSALVQEIEACVREARNEARMATDAAFREFLSLLAAAGIRLTPYFPDGYLVEVGLPPPALSTIKEPLRIEGLHWIAPESDGFSASVIIAVGDRSTSSAVIHLRGSKLYRMPDVPF